MDKETMMKAVEMHRKLGELNAVKNFLDKRENSILKIVVPGSKDSYTASYPFNPYEMNLPSYLTEAFKELVKTEVEKTEAELAAL